MRKNVYEVLDEFEKAPDERSKALVLIKGAQDCPALLDVFRLVYNPQFEFLIKAIPEGYVLPVTPEGMSYSTLGQEIRKFYMFQKGNPVAEKLIQRRREELFINLIESLDPKEVDIVIRIFNKNLKVKGLDKKFVNRVFSNLI